MKSSAPRPQGRGRSWPLPATLVLLLFAARTAHAGRVLQGEDAAPAIVGGTTTQRGRYPYAVSLRQLSNDAHFCGGTLISDRVVMTAAQCVVDGVTGARIADRFHPDVRIGGFHQTADKAGRDYDARRVVATAVHPGFKFGDPSSDDWFNNDIALLLLGAPSSKALPNLPAQLAKPRLPVSTVRGTVTAIGWGVTDESSPDGAARLQEAKMRVLSLKACSYYAYPPKDFTRADNTQICIGNPDFFEEGICAGDGGSPVVLPSAAGDPTADKVIGLTSFSRGCTFFPSGLTNVAQLRSWIDETVEGLVGGKWAASWTGRAKDAPLVKGFDEKQFTRATKRQSETLNILTSPAYSFSGVLSKLAEGTTALRSVLFKVGTDKVQVTLSGGRMTVALNGQAVARGQLKSLLPKGGYVRYFNTGDAAASKAEIVLAGLRVTVLQPYSKAAKSLQGWLDLSVAFGQLPPLPLTGVLASTFPTAETKRDSWIK